MPHSYDPRYLYRSANMKDVQEDCAGGICLDSLCKFVSSSLPNPSRGSRLR